MLTLAGQSVAGLLDFNNQQLADGTDPVGYLDYVTSSAFAVDVAENWQSEYSGACRNPSRCTNWGGNPTATR